jgi:uncharacterized protein with ParB-like and HNH nuclease domain
MENELTLKPIGSLLEYSFNIPAYQRGYRWKSNYQVKNLLDDIESYVADPGNPKSFYCLQPIVVKPISEKYFELIDGQQRLTTLLLIMHYFNETEFKIPKKLFNVHFETRETQRDFLEIVDDSSLANEDIDLFHLHQSYQYIKTWFEKRESSNPSIRGDFYSKVVNKVQVIWYVINDNSKETEIFTRLNIGKIPLTNAELIKALFLSKSGNGNEAENRGLKQIKLATEWDRIEQTLQQPEFWYFITNQPEKYDTRIEYIFDLIKSKKEDDENYFTFYRFFEEFESQKHNPKAIDNIWMNIKKYFLTFEEWFSNRDLYHLIGFLISTGDSVGTLIEEAKDKKKQEFKIWLLSKAKRKIKYQNLNYLDFNSDKQEIRKVLLLFNVLTILENPKSYLRFPFQYYYIQKWDIEHVRSQTSKDIQGKDRENWAITLLEYFTGINWSTDKKGKILEALEVLNIKEKLFCENLMIIAENPKENDDIFYNVFEELSNYFKEDEQFEELDGIGNLVLLDDKTNRMYKNAFFPVKRKHIIQKERQGVYVPLCTKNVFLKAYSQKLGEIMYWNSNDAEDYRKEINRLLKP